MKEKDIERVIDDMITEGLIKEGEQDNADFEAAVRNMSEEDFLSMIYEAHPEYEPAGTELCGATAEPLYSMESQTAMAETAFRGKASEKSNRFKQPSAKDVEEICLSKTGMPSPPLRSQRKTWRTWLISAVAAAAAVAIVLIPAYRSMNTRLCESALVACEAYMPPARGGIDLSKTDIEVIRETLPDFESEYRSALSGDNAGNPYGTSLAEAGWDLATAYLRLGDRGKAKDVFSTLASAFADDEFGEQCRKMAEIL